MPDQQQQINYGAAPNDGQGDPLRDAFIKTDDNFDAIWAAGPVGSNITILNNTVAVVNTNGNLVLQPNGVGVIQANASIVPNSANIRDLGSADRRWRRVYLQTLNTVDYEVEGDLTVSGNLTIQGDTIQIGNLVTDAKTLQLSNTAANAAQAAGSGITVGASDDIATLLYDSGNNTWDTNIGFGISGNVTADYFIGNGSALTGLPVPYTDTDVTTLLSSGNVSTDIFTQGNIEAAYILGNGSQLTGLPEQYGNANVADLLADFGSNNIVTTGNISGGQLEIAPGGGNAWTISGQRILAPSGGEWRSEDDSLDDFITSAPDGYINMQSLYADGNIASELKLEHGVARLVIADAPFAEWTFNTTGQLDVPGDIVPDANGVYNLGSESLQWANLLVGNISAGNIDTGIITLTNGATIKDTVNSVAFGFNAGQITQGEYSVAIGFQAGANTQGNNAIAIGESAGALTQGVEAIAIGYNAGANTQGSRAVAISIGAGQTGQGGDAIAIGYNAGTTSQGNAAVAIGQLAGETSQNGGAVAIGYYAGLDSQSISAVAIGAQAGQTNQGQYAVAIGDLAGNTSQGNSAVAIGDQAGETSQGDGAVAIGSTAGLTVQGNNAVAIGSTAGNSAQGISAVAIGAFTATTSQGARSVAIGQSSGQTTQGADSVAIGQYAGNELQGINAVAIGNSAGYTSQGNRAVAIGLQAGTTSQGVGGIAIGEQAGHTSQGVLSVAIGYYAGANTQSFSAVAIGAQAGETAQGSGAIAIGDLAGRTNQANNSIILNATGANLDQTTANTFTVAPVRNDVANVGEVVFYNTSSKEITYGNTISVAGNVSAARLQNDGNLEVRSNVAGTVKNWTFDTLGDLNLPAGGNIGGSGGISANNITLTGSVNTGGNVNFTSAEATDTARIFADVAGSTTSLVLEVGDDDSDAVVLRHYSFAAGNTIDMLTAQRSSATAANVTVTGNFTATGNVTAQTFIGNISITGNVTGTSPNVSLVAGSYTYTFDNTGVMTLPAMGGNEGGEIQFTQAANSTLSGNTVTVDSYVDQIRFFEGGGTARGVYIDLSQAAAGVGTLLNNRVSAFVDAGTFVTMDNIRATVTSSGNRGLSLATTTGSITYNIGGTYGGVGGTGGLSVNAQTLTTTPTGSIFDWNFGAEGEASTYVLVDKTNNRSYRITVSIGPAYLSNMISIERLV